MSPTENDSSRPTVIAFVSGKGGSGKTLVAAAAADFLSRKGRKVFVLDADLGTGGMTYYLGFKIMVRISRGLSNAMLRKYDPFIRERGPEKYDTPVDLAESKETGFRMIPVGNHRALFRYVRDQNQLGDLLNLAVGEIINYISTVDSPNQTNKTELLESGNFSGIGNVVSNKDKVIIVDCRGGIDDDSIRVCRHVDGIVVIAETDATSIQTCQHLVDVLSDAELSNKLHGFILNKVFDDPSQLAKAGATFFRCPYLGALPFDFASVRNYVAGELPDRSGAFARQVGYVFQKSFPELNLLDPELLSPPVSTEDFARITLSDPAERAGTIIAATILSYVVSIQILAWTLDVHLSDLTERALYLFVIAFAFLTLVPEFRKVLGRTFGGYASAISRLFSIFR